MAKGRTEVVVYRRTSCGITRRIGRSPRTYRRLGGQVDAERICEVIISTGSHLRQSLRVTVNAPISRPFRST